MVTEIMKAWKKIAIGVGIVVVLAIIVGFTVHQSSKNVVTVQTGKVQRQDLATVVSASGEIKPKTYVNVGANAFGKITHLYVKEGDHVKKGQLLAQLENVQSSADVNANEASLQAAETDALAAEAAIENLAGGPAPRAGRLRAQQARLGAGPEPVQRRPDREVRFRQPQECMGHGRCGTGAGASACCAGQGAEGFRGPARRAGPRQL